MAADSFQTHTRSATRSFAPVSYTHLVAGSQVPGNSQIILYMGAEKQATRVEVPDFIGCSVADVNYLASNAGLYVQAKGTDRTDVYVLAAYQDIDPGTEVDSCLLYTSATCRRRCAAKSSTASTWRTCSPGQNTAANLKSACAIFCRRSAAAARCV